MAEKELEDQLMEAGNKLLNPPSPVEDLLVLLDQVESYLSKVEQSPSKSMQNALCPSMKALVASELLRHSDTDVKVSVASCVSEITRITAPDAPYDDEQMKEIFQLLVVAFEKLFDTSSRSYPKRVSILETVAKVRSCVVMLDLECDALIIEMFEHFLKAIRDFHPNNVFSSMETIMTLVLEESEDISPELLSPLLASVKKENQDALPIARKLGEKVLENCTAKLKPYLMQILRSMGTSPNDYSKIVTSICQEKSGTIEHNDVNASGEHLVDEGKLLERTVSDEPPQVIEELKPEAVCLGEVNPIEKKSPKLVMSNGSVQAENDDALISLISPKKKSGISRGATQSAKAEPDRLDSSIVIKSEAKPDQVSKKKRGQKPSSSMHSAEASSQSQIDSDKDNEDLLDQRKSGSKKADNSLSGDPPLNGETVPSVHVKETPTQVPSPTALPNESVKIASPSSQSLPDGTRTKRGQRGSKKKANKDEDTDSGLPSELKGALSSDRIEDEASPSTDVIEKKESDGNSEIEEKSRKRSSKKASSVQVNKDRNPDPASAISKKESGATSDSEAKTLKRSGRKADTRDNNEDESSIKKQGGKPQRGRGKTISQKDVTGESSSKKMVYSPKSAAKSVIKDQSHFEETPKTKSKRKRTPGKEESLDMMHSVEDSGEKLVGSRIKVWWPEDQKFYEGVIESFDSVKKKHKVSYVDGDEEILLLKKEHWVFVDGDTLPDRGQSDDHPSSDTSAQMPQKKKAKTTSDSKAKQLKTDVQKRGKGNSTSKPKDEVTKPDDSKLGNKSMDDNPKTASKPKSATPKTSSKLKDYTQKTGTKSKDDTSKTSTKSKGDALKTSTKSKDDASKTSSRPKDDTPKAGTKSKDVAKTSTKSKDETPKTGKKAGSNGSSAKGRSGTSKVQEREDSGKAKSESETKRGKKRQRV